MAAEPPPTADEIPAGGRLIRGDRIWIVSDDGIVVSVSLACVQTQSFEESLGTPRGKSSPKRKRLFS